MKNKHLILAAILLIAGSLLIGCDNNRENAKEKVKQADQAMADAQAQYDKEWQQFKSDTELKINANQKNIDDFKSAMKTTSKKFKAKYQNEVLTLEQKNIELQKRLNDYKYEGKDNWEKFKQAFNNDIDSVGNALKGLFEKKD
jgi:mRNA-degrading endonuclease YafQ of YafQ-DinJ toxin-antitoxin module